jgi:hypothetical protein
MSYFALTGTGTGWGKAEEDKRWNPDYKLSFLLEVRSSSLNNHVGCMCRSLLFGKCSYVLSL